MADGRIRVLVGVADVDARRPHRHCPRRPRPQRNHFVYTGVIVFPMLPAALSEGITSLNENEDRVAHVIEFSVDAAGTVSDGKVYGGPWCATAPSWPTTAFGAWLEGSAPAPAKVTAAPTRRAAQAADAAAQRMVGGRFQHGAARSRNHRTRPVMQADQPVDIAQLPKNRATSLIEEFHGRGQRRRRPHL